LIDGKHLYFVSLRMAQTHLLAGYLHFLHVDINKCLSVNSHTITGSEAKLLNEINVFHTDSAYGKEMFVAGKDQVVRLEDVHELYTFLKVCYNRLKNKKSQQEKCGFLRINRMEIVPYCIKDNQKYVPLYYFKSIDIRNAIEIDHLNMAYIKFCCLVQCINNELFKKNSFLVISLENIKKYYPKETSFEDYWPPAEDYSRLLVNSNSNGNSFSYNTGEEYNNDEEK